MRAHPPPVRALHWLTRLSLRSFPRGVPAVSRRRHHGRLPRLIEGPPRVPGHAPPAVRWCRPAARRVLLRGSRRKRRPEPHGALRRAPWWCPASRSTSAQGRSDRSRECRRLDPAAVCNRECRDRCIPSGDRVSRLEVPAVQGLVSTPAAAHALDRGKYVIARPIVKRNSCVGRPPRPLKHLRSR